MEIAAKSESVIANLSAQARQRYVARIAGGRAAIRWWNTVIVTASSARQADRYNHEIQRRREQGKIPPGVLYLVVPDWNDHRIGSGGATIQALKSLAESTLLQSPFASLEEWWRSQRVLMIHSGGDSRRLPQYSLSGKLFSLLPVKTPWGDVSSVFDETLALSTGWAERVDAGLLVTSGDVILTFDSQSLEFSRPGVCGVAVLQPVEVGAGHGVYVTNDEGLVYTFLQKPSASEVTAAGGLREGNQVALDTGMLYFDPPSATRLTELAGVALQQGKWLAGPGIIESNPTGPPLIDLYQHITQALTGQWTPDAEDVAGRSLTAALKGIPFRCSVVRGEFTHIGTTALFRQIMTGETSFSRLYEAHQKLGSVNPRDLVSAGVVVDSVLAGGGQLGAGALVIECNVAAPVRVGRGAILQGLTGLSEPAEVPDDVVVHQVPARLPEGRRGVVVRVYGVGDDPKAPLTGGNATWFGRPILAELEALGVNPELVWKDVSPDQRSLWTAALFPLGTVEQAWAWARWMMGISIGFSPVDWAGLERLSLASSTQWLDSEGLAEARSFRTQAHWQETAVALAESGTDLRPLLAQAPGISTLAGAARLLLERAQYEESRSLTEAGSRYYQASQFFGQAGLTEESERSRGLAFRCVQRAVEDGSHTAEIGRELRPWQYSAVTVSAPPRLDLGGGWSDTPPFCLDWGGTVLNVSVELNGKYPIAATVRRLEEPLIRCWSSEEKEALEIRREEDLQAPPPLGSPFSIPLTALGMFGHLDQGQDLRRRLESLGGGLEIRTHVDLPMGSGLGTSSILAATVLRALGEMAGFPLDDHQLSEQAMRLEQIMTTGGGWQDQAGGIFPGAKLILSGPGLRQRLRVQPVDWTAQTEAEFADRFLVCYTGLRRVAKNLLAQVVGRYLAREAATVQVLHSIKTLAVEMAYAMKEGDWTHLGALIDRHWQLNQILDPHTTNAPINALLHHARPYLAGAKLAGAGGGGFLMLLAKEGAAETLRNVLSPHLESAKGAFFDYRIANEGMRMIREE